MKNPDVNPLLHILLNIIHACDSARSSEYLYEIIVSIDHKSGDYVGETNRNGY